MLAGCGHVEIAWPLLRLLGTMADALWCEICQEFKPIWRDATGPEIVGIEILPIPDECPF